MESSDPAGLAALRRRLLEGHVIPAHPLALDRGRGLDERRQRALSRYYLAAGAGGLAVGVHTTQFEIHDEKIGLYRPVLELAAEEARRHSACGGKSPVLVAGVIGPIRQAVREAELARDASYDCALLGLGALRHATDDELIAHVRAVASELPVFGFYLQPSAGGRVLGFDFWRRFFEIEQVVAVKIAPFDRYRTIDVVRAVAESGREREVALYTGNDDNILLDLVTRYRFETPRGPREARIVGGLLGQWAVWTRRAVELLAEAKRISEPGGDVPREWLTLNAQLTDMNAAIFDRANEFSGCIAGIQEVLRRAGLLESTACVSPKERLSPGQAEEIERVWSAYPHLRDDEFVRAGLADWTQGLSQ